MSNHPTNRHYVTTDVGGIEESSSDTDRDDHHHHHHLSIRQEPGPATQSHVHPRHRGRRRSRTPVHIDLTNSISDRQVVDERGRSDSSSPSTIVIMDDQALPHRGRHRSSNVYRMPGFNGWPWPFSVPYPYEYSPAMNNSMWRGSNTGQMEANAVAICGTRARSHSPYHSRRGPHIPPRWDEEQLVLAEDLLRRDKEEKRVEKALADFKLKETERIDREDHIKKDAVRDEQKKLAEEEKKMQDAKKQWEAEQVKKQKEKDEEQKRIEDEIRKRMAKYGFHNKEIEGTIAGKKEQYCHKHEQPYPCDVCINMGFEASGCVGPYLRVTSGRRPVLVRPHKHCRFII